VDNSDNVDIPPMHLTGPPRRESLSSTAIKYPGSNGKVIKLSINSLYIDKLLDRGIEIYVNMPFLEGVGYQG
jgi:hypothetical protein